MSTKIFDEAYDKEIFELNRNIPDRVIAEDGTLYDTEGNEISLMRLSNAMLPLSVR